VNKEYQQALGESGSVLMSESLQKTMRPSDNAEFHVYQGDECILSSHSVCSFQKNSTIIETVCSAPRPSVVLQKFQNLSHDEIMQIEYRGVKFENLKCQQWGIVMSELSLPGETKVELIFELVNNTQPKEILND